MEYKEFEEALKFYGISESYTNEWNRCRKELSDSAKKERYKELQSIFYEVEYCEMKKLWKINRKDMALWENAEDFLIGMIILEGYKIHSDNMERLGFSEEQIKLQKDRVRSVFYSQLKKPNVLSQAIWAAYFIRGHMLEVGRLQYEHRYDEGDTAFIAIHIPKGDNLLPEDVAASLRESEVLINKYFHFRRIQYICLSWLVSNQVYELVEKDSNIAKFHDLFTVTDDASCLHDILALVFGNGTCSDYSSLPENTSLQRKVKEALLSGKDFYEGFGVLKRMPL